MRVENGGRGNKPIDLAARRAERAGQHDPATEGFNSLRGVAGRIAERGAAPYHRIRNRVVNGVREGSDRAAAAIGKQGLKALDDLDNRIKELPDGAVKGTLLVGAEATKLGVLLVDGLVEEAREKVADVKGKNELPPMIDDPQGRGTNVHQFPRGRRPGR